MLLAIGIPAYLVVGVALLLAGFPAWTALVLFAVAVLDGVWVLQLRRSRG